MLLILISLSLPTVYLDAAACGLADGIDVLAGATDDARNLVRRHRQIRRTTTRLQWAR